jgi:flagellar biosynthesis protein FliP
MSIIRSHAAGVLIAAATVILPLLVILAPVPAAAQQAGFQTLIQETNAVTSTRIVQLILAVTVLSVAPGILVMVTSFTRFIIALSFLRSGLGLPSTPANIVLISLALFMTLFTMAPVFDKAWETGLKPYMDNKIAEEEAFHRISDPLRQFMTANVRQKDLDLFAELSRRRGRGRGRSYSSRLEDSDSGVHGV